MQVHTENADAQLKQIASSIDLRPESWSGWNVLRIEAGEYLSHQEFIEATFPIKAIIGAYLREMEGAAFFCDKKYIYLICKGPQKNILRQSAEQISELVFEEIYLSSRYHVYDLSSDAESFVERVFQDIGGSNPLNIADGEIEKFPPLLFSPEDIHRKKVLLVEDDAVIRWMIRNSLKNECDFSAVSDGEALKSLYPRIRPDIVFLDIGLPDIDGGQILEWIMGHDPSASVIMLSAQDNLENISKCLAKGAKAFLPKPFIKENLLQHIHEFARSEQISL